MKQYTSTATRDGRWWVLQCDQEPGAISQVARLDQAADDQREAIAMITGQDEADIEVVVSVTLEQVIAAGIQLAEEKRELAEELQREASALIVGAARSLVEGDAMSLRDAGYVLGVSHQRVSQLLNPMPSPSKGVSRAVKAGDGSTRTVTKGPSGTYVKVSDKGRRNSKV